MNIARTKRKENQSPSSLTMVPDVGNAKTSVLPHNAEKVKQMLLTAAQPATAAGTSCTHRDSKEGKQLYDVDGTTVKNESENVSTGG